MVDKGIEKNIPIVFFNDMPIPWQGTVEITFLKDGEVISGKRLAPVQVEPADKTVIHTVIKFPEQPGDYEMIAEIEGIGDQPVRSYRKFEIR
jgi:hypothetical protein